jgi:hypothetical protein
LSGFSDGEGCFYVSVYKSPKSKLGLATQLVFKITQHSRDSTLLKTISKFFKCGRVEKRNNEACDFVVSSLKDIEQYIIPFFSNYPLQGSKLLDFNDFKKVYEIMKNKNHLTKEGIEKIKSIKFCMNTGRKYN